MAVSRPFLLALIAAVLAAAAFMATTSARNGGDEGQASTPATPGAAEPKPDAKAPKPDPLRTARAERPTPPKPRTEGVPAPVETALGAGRTVVLFFFQRGGADDAAVADAVDGLRGRPRVAIFRAPISQLSRYRAITSTLGVSQAPAIVIARRGGAQLLEGYIDAASLAQQVSDAR